MTNKYKAVVFTGGGYFGVTIASFLSFLGKDYDLPNHVDCLAGTSIGGIIACAFMGGCSTQNLLDGFVQNGEKIFTKRWQNKINPLSLPFYGNEALKEVIESFVGEQTIGDAKKRFPCTAMFVPATNMTKNKLKVFDTVDPKDEHYKLSEVSLYTSAAEFYFPVLEDEGDAITDGGIRELLLVPFTCERD